MNGIDPNRLAVVVRRCEGFLEDENADRQLLLEGLIGALWDLIGEAKAR